MKTVLFVLPALLLAGCMASKVNPSVTEREKKYLAELPQSRSLSWGPCMCTYHFLADTGAAGVPMVIRTLDGFSGSTNIQMRALIVDGAWHYSKGTNTVIAPIMDRAACDPAPAVQAAAQKWFDQQRGK